MSMHRLIANHTTLFRDFVQHAYDFSTQDGVPSTMITLAAIALTLWYVSELFRAWYRLRHIPTPCFIAAVSYFWLAWVAYSGKQHWTHRQLHTKHGHLVRVGPREIVTDDPQIVKKISSSQCGYARSSWYSTGRFDPYHDNLLTTLEPRSHKIAKARTAAAYSGRETPGIENAIDQEILILKGLLRKMSQSAAKVNLEDISCYFTMDVIVRLAFGGEARYLMDLADHHDFFGQLRALWTRLSVCADVPWIRNILFSPLILRLIGPKPTDKTGFGALMGIANNLINQRHNTRGAKRDDMLESLIKRGFDREQCQSESLFLLLAGTESTACAIRGILALVITTPTVYRRLKEEIAGNAQSQNRIPFDEAAKLPYLRAVIYEGLRMRPPLLGFWPKVVPAGGDEFHGKFIPEGTSIGVNHSSLLRSTSLFGADANTFNPSRFLDLAESRRRDMERNVELVFGYGQWMCAGKNIALMELYKVVFEIMRSFDLELADFSSRSRPQSYGVFFESDLTCKVSEAR